MVVVAHRPIGIEAVDQLLVLKDGRMQAFGPKETVLGQVLQRVPRAADQDRVRSGSRENHDRRAAGALVDPSHRRAR